MRGQQIALHSQQIAPTRGEVQRGLHSHLALDQIAHCLGTHAHAGHGAICNINYIGSGLCQQACPSVQLVS